MQETLKKFRFKENGVVLHAPAAMEKAFSQAGFKTTLDKKSKSTNTLVFFNQASELKQFLKDQLKYVEPDSVLWFAYPKGTSKVKTDINRDSIRETAEEFGITTVTAISIDDTWSALRFRPLDRVGK